MSKWIKNWFSNYNLYEEPLVYQNLIFRTPENFFQAMKAKKELIEIRKKISLMNPGQAKKFWRNNYNKKNYMRDDWFDISLSVMEFAQKHRYQPGMKYFERLMKTEGLIVETNNWHDNWWGDCICGQPKCAEKGKNHLGRIITNIRDEYDENLLDRKAS